MRQIFFRLTLPLALVTTISVGCLKVNEVQVGFEQVENLQVEKGGKYMEKDLSLYFKDITLADTLKKVGENNPVMTQRFGADPYAIVYEDRVYIYMTGDTLEYDENQNIRDNTYGKINTINVLSSEDLVNWTDHGSIYAAGYKGASKWGNNSWAPAVAYKEINGEMKFFLYFANGGNGIGVLTADSPVGPFTDPLNKALVSRNTPNCDTVSWLFDPAVLVDNDGRAYLYFGGGIPDGQYKAPGTGRVVELGEDMISLEGIPQALDIPYLFEDSGINKIGDTYYYSYCSNWNVPPEEAKELGFESAEIVYMTSKHPMGPFILQQSILKNPGKFFGCYGNNHHCLFEFHNNWYIAYHTQTMEEKMGISGGYRNTFINQVNINEDGSIAPITATTKGVESVKALNPYQKVEAETMATMGGINTIQEGKYSTYYGSGNMAVSDIETGDWIALSNVDFGEEGATSYTASVKVIDEQEGAIQIRKGALDGEVIGYLEIQSDEAKDYKELSATLISQVKGVHDLFFVFYGEGYRLDYWYFS